MKYFRKIVTMISAFILLAAVSVCCFAVGSPGAADLEEIASSIEYPRTKEYLDDYVFAVVKAPGGHSVYAYGSADRQGSVYSVMNGEKVKILAERGDCSCVIVLSQKKARWIKTEYLVPTDNRPEEHWVEIFYSMEYNGSLTEYEYSYNADGKVTEVIEHRVKNDGSESRVKEIRQFGTDGRIRSSASWVTETDELVETRYYAFGNDGRLKQVQTFDWTGRLTQEQNDSYTADVHTVESIDYDDNGDVITRRISFYDLDRKPLGRETYNEYDELTSKSRINYNEDGEKASEIYYDPSGKITADMRYRYSYNTEGLVTEEIMTHNNGVLAGKESVHEYSYDSHGNITEEVTTYDGKTETVIKHRWGLFRDGKIIEAAD